MKVNIVKRSLLLGHYIKVGLAYASNKYIRYRAASGGAVTSLLQYLLDTGLVDAVLVPRLRVSRGRVLGKYEIVYDSKRLVEFAGSVYAPVDIGDALKEVMNKNLSVAVVGLPCLIRGLRGTPQRFQLLKENIKVFLGLYCNNVPNPRALEYVARTVLKIDPEEISHVAFRGCGWPGYATITLKTGKTIRIPFQAFWGSGFGQYFYSKACFLCSDQTAELADISFGDPWTYQRNIGTGKTLIVIRSKVGLDIVENAVRSGYLVFEELPSHLYAVQYTTLLKKTIRTTAGRKTRYEYLIPPSITSILYELDYIVGSKLARRETMWKTLKLYIKTRSYIFKPFVMLDHLIKPGFARVLDRVSRAWITR